MVREWMQMEDCMIDTKNRLPKIYLSGPMRGVEYHNRPTFDKWEKVFIDGGEFEPVNPVKIGDGIASQQDMENDDELMQKVFDADIAELSNCDAIFMMRGWENSEGARKELRHALENGKKVLLESELSAKMEAYDAEKLSLRIERFSNRFGVHEDLKRLALLVAGMHRTLVQSFTSGFVLQFVKKMAENRRSDRFDDRDAQAVKVCDEMWTAVEKEYSLSEGEDIKLAMI